MISIFRENRNILELIVLIILQKLFGKKLCSDLDFARNVRQRTNESKIAYNNQWIICVSLLRKTEKESFVNIDPNILKGNRKFLKTVNLLEKSYSKGSISFINKDGLITKSEDLVRTFNMFFNCQ